MTFAWQIPVYYNFKDLRLLFFLHVNINLCAFYNFSLEGASNDKEQTAKQQWSFHRTIFL